MDDFTGRLSSVSIPAPSPTLSISWACVDRSPVIRRYSTEKRIAGRVLTVRLDRVEGRDISLQPPRHLCTAAIEAASPGDIIVIEQRTGIDAACWGGNLTIGAQMRGVAGVIADGPVRDVDDSRRSIFPSSPATTPLVPPAENRRGRDRRPGRYRRCSGGSGRLRHRRRERRGLCERSEIERVLEAAEAIGRARRPWRKPCAKANPSAR